MYNVRSREVVASRPTEHALSLIPMDGIEGCLSRMELYMTIMQHLRDAHDHVNVHVHVYLQYQVRARVRAQVRMPAKGHACVCA